jgi:1-acyl-sn-glycerol-3-phosphate acyltransferase
MQRKRQYLISFVCRNLYYHEVCILNKERLPTKGPVLYLGLHRNGAVDGWVYEKACKDAVFLISTQLVKSPFARLFFDGIPIVRDKDRGDKKQNAEAMEKCLEVLGSGGKLFIFPEGTSSLGPKHLPFKSGAVQLILKYLEQNNEPLNVVPLGIHYEVPWQFRSRVVIKVGHPVPLTLEDSLTKLDRRKTLKTRIRNALEAVGVNYPNTSSQETAQKIAFLQRRSFPGTYFNALKKLEKHNSEEFLQTWKRFDQLSKEHRLFLSQGVPIFSEYGLPIAFFRLMLSAPFVVTAILCNLPPLGVAAWAGKHFPDDRNVIALWKTLSGVPAFSLWVILLGIFALLYGQLPTFGVYLVVTLLGLKNLNGTRYRIVECLNGSRGSEFNTYYQVFLTRVKQWFNQK